METQPCLHLKDRSMEPHTPSTTPTGERSTGSTWTNQRERWVDNKVRIYSVTQRAVWLLWKLSGSTAATPEHPSTEEGVENGLKNSFMKMTETLKEEMKNSLEKQIEERTNKKKWKKSTSP